MSERRAIFVPIHNIYLRIRTPVIVIVVVLVVLMVELTAENNAGE